MADSEPVKSQEDMICDIVNRELARRKGDADEKAKFDAMKQERLGVLATSLGQLRFKFLNEERRLTDEIRALLANE